MEEAPQLRRWSHARVLQRIQTCTSWLVQRYLGKTEQVIPYRYQVFQDSAFSLPCLVWNLHRSQDNQILFPCKAWTRACDSQHSWSIWFYDRTDGSLARIDNVHFTVIHDRFGVLRIGEPGGVPV